jgi:hypothetical protein
MEHAFTKTIKDVLRRHFGPQTDEVFERSVLLHYLNIKTRAATRGSKSRSSFANLYAIYVLVEDYLAGGFNKKGDYSKYNVQWRSFYKAVPTPAAVAIRQQAPEPRAQPPSQRGV